MAALQEDDNVRDIVPQVISEFLGAPIIYVKNELRDDYEALAADLPVHELHEAPKGKQELRA